MNDETEDDSASDSSVVSDDDSATDSSSVLEDDDGLPPPPRRPWVAAIDSLPVAAENVLRRIGFGEGYAPLIPRRDLDDDDGESDDDDDFGVRDPARRPEPATIFRRAADCFRGPSADAFDVAVVDLEIDPENQTVPDLVGACAERFRAGVGPVLNDAAAAAAAPPRGEPPPPAKRARRAADAARFAYVWLNWAGLPATRVPFFGDATVLADWIGRSPWATRADRAPAVLLIDRERRAVRYWNRGPHAPRRGAGPAAAADHRTLWPPTDDDDGGRRPVVLVPAAAYADRDRSLDPFYWYATWEEADGRRRRAVNHRATTLDLAREAFRRGCGARGFAWTDDGDGGRTFAVDLYRSVYADPPAGRRPWNDDAEDGVVDDDPGFYLDDDAVALLVLVVAWSVGRAGPAAAAAADATLRALRGVAFLPELLFRGDGVRLMRALRAWQRRCAEAATPADLLPCVGAVAVPGRGDALARCCVATPDAPTGFCNADRLAVVAGVTVPLCAAHARALLPDPDGWYRRYAA